MATAKLTLIGMYNYDDTLFDGLQLPDYFDTETLVNTILFTGGEFGVLYPSVPVMKRFISAWSAKNQRYFERLALLMETDYSPLENYNRQEKWNDKGTSESNSDVTTNSQTDTTDTGQVSAFNSSQFENRTKDTGKETVKDKSEANASGSFDTTREGYARGNIGVMSSQDMFIQEMSVVGISPYDVLAGDFINECCIKVYV